MKIESYGLIVSDHYDNTISHSIEKGLPKFDKPPAKYYISLNGERVFTIKENKDEFICQAAMEKKYFDSFIVSKNKKYSPEQRTEFLLKHIASRMNSHKSKTAKQIQKLINKIISKNED